jgi:hypothetical protein
MLKEISSPGRVIESIMEGTKEWLPSFSQPVLMVHIPVGPLNRGDIVYYSICRTEPWYRGDIRSSWVI